MALERSLFWIAGVIGLVVMVAHYFLEGMINRQYPPDITHSEYYYGWIGVGIGWQLAFLVIGSDPVRYRPMMLPAVFEKAAFGCAWVVLFLHGRASTAVLGIGLLDLTVAVLFATAFWRVGRAAQP